MQFLRFFIVEFDENIPVDFLVKIYTEPRDFELGQEMQMSSLAHT